MIRRVCSQLHRYVLWTLISVVLWAWIFTLLTDAPSAQKVVVFADTFEKEDNVLIKELEYELPDGIRMVQVHPFSYAAFSVSEIENADILILTGSEMEQWIDKLQKIPDAKTGFLYEDEIYGIPIYQAATTDGAAKTFFQFAEPGAPPEDFYLCFNKNSLHLGAWNGSGDQAAIEVAHKILQLP